MELRFKEHALIVVKNLLKFFISIRPENRAICHIVHIFQTINLGMSIRGMSEIKLSTINFHEVVTSF